jgi:hypothetical protein
VARDRSAERGADALVAETDPEDGQAAPAGGEDDLHRRAGLGRAHRPGRDDHPGEARIARDPSWVDAIVAPHVDLDLRRQELDDVVDERVVVVDDEDRLGAQRSTYRVGAATRPT